MGVRQKGIGVAWGISSTVYNAAGAAMPIKGISQSLKKTAEESEHRDPATGDINGLTIFNPTKDLSLRVFPSAATLALAITAGSLTPEVGDSFVITDANDPEMAGTYIVKEVTKEKEVAKRVEFDITLKKYATDISADIA